ncbi:MAG TPA: hypothetical protein VF885_15245 [Arthrobacter sp.]
MTVTPAQQHALFRIAASVNVEGPSLLSVTQSEGNVTVVVPGGMYPPVRITVDAEGRVNDVSTHRDSPAEGPDVEWVDIRDTSRASLYDELVESVAEFVARGLALLPQLDAPTLNAPAAVAVLAAIPGDALLALTNPDRAVTVAAIAAEPSVVLASAKALYQVRRDESPSVQQPAWYLLSSGRQAVYRTDARMILTALATTGNPFVANLPVEGAPTPKQAAAVVKVFAKHWAKRA